MPTTVSDDSRFERRHIGPGPADVEALLDVIGVGTLDTLVDLAIPATIRTRTPLNLPAARNEQDVLAALRTIAENNRRHIQMIGLGYYETITPAVLRRNLLENPAWYTSYTPYQPEISQGRLEALLTFQTLIADLTALPVAGASLLDEATAVAEAVLLMRRASRQTSSQRVVVDANCFPQTRAVLQGRVRPLGIEIVNADLSGGLPDGEFFGVVFQNPGADGAVRDLTALIAGAKARGALTTVATDLLASTLFAAPGDQGADIAVGSAQRLGVPLFFGGPHAGFMSVRDGLERMLPGRLVGVSRDRDGAPAYRLALQTREQHIRRDKATSNICTAQALLANVAAMYGAYHGPDGLTAIAHRIHSHARELAAGLRESGISLLHDHFFDTVVASVPDGAARIVAAAAAGGINLRYIDSGRVGISCGESTTMATVSRVLAAFGASPAAAVVDTNIAEPLRRRSTFLSHPTFHTYQSETAMMRYLRALADKDLALDRTMIPLGSCTMKLNSAVEMEPISWPEFADIHPFAPADQTRGYQQLITDLERWLADITGYDSVSVQPNAGSQGELAGLLAIRAFHDARGDTDRRICLIPQSAHGTNAASAVLAGLQVVVVATRDGGDIDLGDLRSKLDAHRGKVAAIMITYPSTHGVYESDVTTVCDLIHSEGGQVYIDGANLNALVGLARPGEFGGDVSHLNLHKTFCIPHGGGGPGVGPVAVRAHLAPYLPGHPLDPAGNAPVSAAPYGSAGILPITWAYIALMGADGLRAATQTAVLSANYIARRLDPYYPVLYTGNGGLVAHECILDLRQVTKATGITAEDVAKRLIDYGFHAPTLSFPVNGTLMVEPTESEDRVELDRFVDAMIAIHGEITQIAAGVWPVEDSPLRHAPHTAAQVTGEDWALPYSRHVAAFPAPTPHGVKYWPPVRRIDGVFGDRNLVCACPPPEAFQDPNSLTQSEVHA